MRTPTDMEQVLENINRRLDRIEQILPTLATKEDLKAFPTRDDPKGFATKDDLQAFEARVEATSATKEDLNAFATKADLQAFAAKVDEAFAEANRFTRVLHEDLVERIKVLGERRRNRR